MSKSYLVLLETSNTLNSSSCSRILLPIEFCVLIMFWFNEVRSKVFLAFRLYGLAYGQSKCRNRAVHLFYLTLLRYSFFDREMAVSMEHHKDYKILRNNSARKWLYQLVAFKTVAYQGKLKGRLHTFPVDLSNCKTQVYFHNVVAKLGAHEYFINLITLACQ